MATASRSRTLAAPQQDVWALIADADHMPRWWPGVTRVEGVSEDHFTQVFKTKKGRSVRLDFEIIESDPPWLRTWRQEIDGTPFQRVLTESVISVELKSVGEGTEVTISHQQRLRGYSRTGGFMLRRATRKKLDEALDGLARVV